MSSSEGKDFKEEPPVNGLEETLITTETTPSIAVSGNNEISDASSACNAEIAAVVEITKHELPLSNVINDIPSLSSKDIASENVKPVNLNPSTETELEPPKSPEKEVNSFKTSAVTDCEIVIDTRPDNFSANLPQTIVIENKNTEKLSEPILKTSKPLCADYRSDSDSDSVDSESDSSSSLSDSTTDSSSESEDSFDSEDSGNCKNKKNQKNKNGDLSLCDLPPIEDLKISVPEDACVEIGKISSIVDSLVVVESYKGSAALDLDTVLFLDGGKRTLGKVFEILGPITEPVYAVRFNSADHIKELGIEKDSKVYFAPKTQHTNFVFMSEVLKHKGSDASWKDNIEAPPEFQDFSDDEEEKQFKNKDYHNNSGENKSRKRGFDKSKKSHPIVHPPRFQNPNISSPRRPNFQQNSSMDQFRPRNQFPTQNPVNHQFPIRAPPYPQHMYYPPRFSGPPFPTFGPLTYVNHNPNFQQPFFQQRTHAYPQTFEAWARPMFRPNMPPPPPPPPSDQGGHYQ